MRARARVRLWLGGGGQSNQNDFRETHSVKLSNLTEIKNILLLILPIAEEKKWDAVREIINEIN